jgi:hypothetical protein
MGSYSVADPKIIRPPFSVASGLSRAARFAQIIASRCLPTASTTAHYSAVPSRSLPMAARSAHRAACARADSARNAPQPAYLPCRPTTSFPRASVRLLRRQYLSHSARAPQDSCQWHEEGARPPLRSAASWPTVVAWPLARDTDPATCVAEASRIPIVRASHRRGMPPETFIAVSLIVLSLWFVRGQSSCAAWLLLSLTSASRRETFRIYEQPPRQRSDGAACPSAARNHLL